MLQEILVAIFLILSILFLFNKYKKEWQNGEKSCAKTCGKCKKVSQ